MDKYPKGTVLLILLAIVIIFLMVANIVSMGDVYEKMTNLTVSINLLQSEVRNLKDSVPTLDCNSEFMSDKVTLEPDEFRIIGGDEGWACEDGIDVRFDIVENPTRSPLTCIVRKLNQACVWKA